jgi:hypothetical protein
MLPLSPPRVRLIGVASATIALALGSTVPGALAQGGPTTGTYQLVVTSETATPDLQAGTYTLKLQGSQGSLTSEYAGFPGSTCPLTYEAQGPDLTLAIGGSGPVDPCTRTTTLVYRDTGPGIQFLHQSTDPEDRAAGDKALFDGKEWLLAGGAGSAASVAPAQLPTGTWEVTLSADDFAPYMPSGTDMSGAAATYVLAFDGATGTFSAEQGGSVLGGCPFDVSSLGAGQVTLALGGQCDRTTGMAWVEAGDQLVFSGVTTTPADSAAFDRALFTAKAWTRRGPSSSTIPAVSAAPSASQPAQVDSFLPVAGSYTVRLTRTDMQPYLSRSDDKQWKPTTFTLILAGDTGSISDSTKGNTDFDADLRISGSASDFEILVPSKHTDIHAGWTQAADGTLTFSNLDVQSAMDADAWKGVLGAKPWTLEAP